MTAEDPALVLLAGEDRAALRAAIDRIGDPLPTAPPPAAPAGVRLAILAPRREVPERLRLARDRLDGDSLLSIRKKGIFFGTGDAAGRIAFLFPGQGSQRAGMLKDLAGRFGTVRAWFDALDHAYERIAGLGPATALLERPDDPALYDLGKGSQLGTVASLAVHEVLARLGIEPDVVVGHSNGEHAAIVAAGMVAPEDARPRALCDGLCRLALPGSSPGPPDEPQAMLAVSGVDRAALEALVAASPPGLFLAMDNCPRQQVLAGLGSRIEAAARELADRGGIVARLPFARAYHSPLFADWARALDVYYRSLRLVPPRVPVHSCLTADALPDDPELARRHMVDQWTARVEFRRTIERLHETGVRTFVEVGPGDTLTAFVQDTLRGRPHLAASACSPGPDDVGALRRLLAELFAHGIPVDPRRLDDVAARPAEIAPVRARATSSIRRRFTRAGDPWVADHSFGRHATGRPDVVPLAVVPFTVSLSVVAGAASRPGRPPVAVVTDLRAHRFLALDGGERTVVIETAREPEGVRVRLVEDGEGVPGPSFEGLAHPGAAAGIRGDRVPVDPAARPPEVWDAASFYGRYAFHGPSLRCIERVLRVGPRGVEAELVVPAAGREARAGGLFDPALLDASGQLVAFWLLERAGLEPTFGIFPFAARRAEALEAPGAPGTRLLCRGTVELAGDAGTRADFVFFRPDGTPVAAIEGLAQRLGRFPGPIARRLLAGEWADLSGRVPSDPDRAVRRVPLSDLETYTQAEGLWSRALAHVALAETELSRWLSHPGSPEERAGWLLERIAAKEAYRSLAADRGRLAPDLPEIAILGDAWIDAPDGSLGPARLELGRTEDSLEAQVRRPTSG